MRITALAALLALASAPARGAAARFSASPEGMMASHAFTPSSHFWGDAIGDFVKSAAPGQLASLPIVSALRVADFDSRAGLRLISPLVHTMLQNGISSEEFVELDPAAQAKLLARAEAEAVAGVRERALEMVVQSGNPEAHAADLYNTSSALGELEAHFALYMTPQEHEAVAAARKRTERRLLDLRLGTNRRRVEAIAAELGIPAPGAAALVEAESKISELAQEAARAGLHDLAFSDPQQDPAPAIEALRRLAVESGDDRVALVVLDGLKGRHDAFDAILAIGRQTTHRSVALGATRAALNLFAEHKGKRFVDAGWTDFEEARAALKDYVSETRNPLVAQMTIRALEGMLVDNRSSLQRAQLADTIAAIRAWAAGTKLDRLPALKVPAVDSGWSILGLERDNIVRTQKRGILGQLAEGANTHRKGAFNAFFGLGAMSSGLFLAGFPLWALPVAGLAVLVMAAKAFWMDHSAAAGGHLAVLAAFLIGSGFAAGTGAVALSVMGAATLGWLALAIRSFRADKPGHGVLFGAALLSAAFVALGYLNSLGLL